MPLIIHDQLINPPTWFPSFRDLTLYCNIFLKLPVLVASTRTNRDSYYRFMKERGGMDFVAQFVCPGEEDGIHLDLKPDWAPTIVTDRIAPENVHKLIARINAVRG